MQVAGAIGLLLLSFMAAAQEVDVVPFYAQEQALKLSYEPVAYMVDDATCERVEGQRMADGRLVGEGATSALFRKDKPRVPFLRVRTRADGVYVARFSANPNEVILSRAYTVDPRTKRFVYGEPTVAVCVAGKAEVGDLVPAS